MLTTVFWLIAFDDILGPEEKDGPGLGTYCAVCWKEGCDAP